MTRQAIIDSETLGLEPGCVVLSIGITIFDDEKLNSFDELVEQGQELVLDIVPQQERGLLKNPKTIKWWNEQNSDARRILLPENPLDPEWFYPQIEEKLGSPFLLNKYKWYARGPVFDMAILEAMWKKFGVSVPWKYWNVRDSRTVYDEHNVDYRKIPQPDNMIFHNALHDAAWDAWILQRTWNAPEELATWRI